METEDSTSSDTNLEPVMLNEVSVLWLLCVVNTRSIPYNGKLCTELATSLAQNYV